MIDSCHYNCYFDFAHELLYIDDLVACVDIESFDWHAHTQSHPLHPVTVAYPAQRDHLSCNFFVKLTPSFHHPKSKRTPNKRKTEIHNEINYFRTKRSLQHLLGGVKLNVPVQCC